MKEFSELMFLQYFTCILNYNIDKIDFWDKINSVNWLTEPNRL